MWMPRIVGLAAALLVGCATVPAGHETAQKQGEPVTVEVEALLGDSSTWQSIAPEQVLHSGDRFAVVVRSDRPVYGYLALVKAGKTVLLFGNEAGQRASRDEPLHIPPEGGPFRLDNQPGEEHLRIVVSRGALSEQQILALIDESRSGTREPPPVMTERNRNYSLSLRLGEKGHAMGRFMFQHQ